MSVVKTVEREEMKSVCVTMKTTVSNEQYNGIKSGLNMSQFQVWLLKTLVEDQ